ncbi:MAG: type III-A CRISPR-associated RAMP protein Csm4 [Ruminococcus sp.]|nr:type III-A CRISPR-associated RAMP protein Csm4 [Ruminococcus sp.]
MRYKIYRLKFSTAVHFGNGRLGNTDNVFLADRLFSAMCTESVRSQGAKGAQRLADMAMNDRLLLSDGLPYMGDTLYIPKPIIHIKSSEEGNSAVKKAFRKLRFIPENKLEEYTAGRLDAEKEAAVFSELGQQAEKVSAAVSDMGDTLPYRIGTFRFADNCGLYFILGYENEEVYDLADSLIYSLQYEGIGGKVSAGLGKFMSVPEDMPRNFMKRLTGEYERYMSLSVCMAKEEEMERAVEGSGYSLIKRSGFISSPDYADRPVKRKDIYCFSAGSCFARRFGGEVFDLRGKGRHPVYRYAKPIFMGVM